MESQSSETPTHVVVDVVGNIGAGKSTILKEIEAIARSEASCIDILCEPIEEWRAPIAAAITDDDDDNDGAPDRPRTPLQYLYMNPKANAFAFQMFALQTRVHQQLSLARAADVIVVERNFSSDVDVFADSMLANGFMTPLQLYTYTHLKKLSKQAVSDVVFKGRRVRELTVYLRTQPRNCMQRLQRRGREEECCNISIPYLEDLHKLHERHYHNGRTATGDEELVIDMDYLCEKDGVVKTLKPSDIASTIWSHVRGVMKVLTSAA